MKRKLFISAITLTTLLLSSCTMPSIIEISSSSDETNDSTTDTVSNGTSDEQTSSNEVTTDSNSTTGSPTTTEETITEPIIPTTDPYQDINSFEDVKNFYTFPYKRATSYEDAQYRTKHHLISGDYNASDYKVAINNENTNSTATVYRNNVTDYTYRPDKSYESYKLYSLDGTYETIYYGGAYSSINEVAAYLFAFGETPANIMSSNSDYTNAAERYRYGRVNDNEYSGPQAKKYVYEPALYGQIRGKTNKLNYNETDFGDWVYYNDTVYDTKYDPTVYVTENKEYARGVMRFCYITKSDNASTFDDLNNRRVYFTYNHYNDFVEFLNYKDGFGKVFGNMTEGREYNGKVAYDKDGEIPMPVDVSYLNIR